MCFQDKIMAILYGPVIVCVISVIGTIAQEGHIGHAIHGEHGGHGGQVIRQKIGDAGDISIARATDPFGASHGKRASSHGSRATHGEHGTHGVHSGHGGHAIVGGSHGVQGHGSHGSDSKVGHGNHVIKKSDHTEHSQASIHQGSTPGQDNNFKHRGHDIDSGGHSDHKTSVQELVKSHDIPVHKMHDGHIMSEINAVSSHAGHSMPTHTAMVEHSITKKLQVGHEIPVQGSVGRQNINAENMHHGHALPSQETLEGHDIHAKDMNVGHSIPSAMDQQNINMHSGHDMKKEAAINTHNAHSVHDSHSLSSHGSTHNNDVGHDQHTMPSHGATPGHNADHIAHSGHVMPSIEKKNNLPRLNAHEIHAGHVMASQSGSAIPSRHRKVEGSETMSRPEHKSHVLPSHEVHEVPTIIQNTSTKQKENGGRFTKTQGISNNLSILGHSQEINHGIHTPDTNGHGFSGTPSHLSSSITQLPDKHIVQSLSSINNQWQDSNIRQISPLPSPHKPQVHDAHDSHEKFNMKNSKKPSDSIGSGLSKMLTEHGGHTINDHVPNVMLMSNSADPPAKDSTVHQHRGGHTIENDNTKLNQVHVVGTTQNNKQSRLNLMKQRIHETHEAQHQLSVENIHTVTGSMEGLNSRKDASSNVRSIAHNDPGQMELHDHPIDVPASSSNSDSLFTVDSNLNVDTSRRQSDSNSNAPNVNRGAGQRTLNVPTTSQTGTVANSAGSSLNLNNFLENINTHLNKQGFGFTEPSTSNTGVLNSLGQQSQGARRQDNHNIPAHTGSSFDVGTASNWGRGRGDTFAGFNHNSGIREGNSRHQPPPTTPSPPPIESTTSLFGLPFSGEFSSMDSVFMRLFDPLTADMMLNRNVYPPIVDPFSDPRVPHNHGPMHSNTQNNGISLFDLFAAEL